MSRCARSVALGVVVLMVASACTSASPEYEIVLDGLNEPRGLSISTDGTLCVAEAGTLADGQTVEEGPTANRANTGSVTCVDSAGTRERIITQLPYVLYNITGVTTGPADVVEIDGDIYLLTGEGEGNLARSLLRIVDPSSPPDDVADFLAFAVETAEPDFLDEIDIISNPFAMILDRSGTRVLVTDGATGRVLAAGLDGEIRVFSEVPGHEVLTGIARGPDGSPYVASFSQLPHAEGDGAVLRLQSDGSFDIAVDDLTTPIDLGFDSSGRMYVLEFIDGTVSSDPYRGKTGQLVRFDVEGAGWAGRQVVVKNLPFPTALLVDDTDRIYISVHGAFSAPGAGLVVRFDGLSARPADELPSQFAEEST
ncbi:MAG: hypothetical protein BMS9Abin17_1426 [Acidimicrobiia bacterium]|nr:MAG: hypothetical protein BMS9Abin17_1426 [Acidimicrobiia bacterium]